MFASVRRACPLFALLVAAVGAACNGSSCPNPGGPVSAAPDTHCASADGGAIVQSTSQAACHPEAGPPDGGGGSGYGPTLSNGSGDDDDCKYHAAWTSSAVCEGGVVFTLTATNKTDGSPVIGAGVIAEVFLNPTHPAPTAIVHTKESPPGTYVTDPVTFDAPGEWTIRFHLFDSCDDTQSDSPHGHVAFYVQVP